MNKLVSCVNYLKFKSVRKSWQSNMFYSWLWQSSINVNIYDKYGDKNY